jgi:glycosyltransferase involved in cell wall biosynthesis
MLDDRFSRTGHEKAHSRFPCLDREKQGKAAASSEGKWIDRPIQTGQGGPMKIWVTGTRGIPDIPGGVEKHAEELYPRIAAMGHDVILATRTAYVTERKKEFRGVRLRHIFSPRIKSLEAIVHTFLSVLAARRENPDIVHIHAVGPSLLTPFARLLGLRVVTTNHGPDYDRQKWGRLARLMLRLGEWAGGCFSNQVIVISRIIETIIKTRCGRSSHLIPNGVTLPQKSESTGYLDSIGVTPGAYILAVSRFVPEKGLDLLVDAFENSGVALTLVIAGDADHETPYSLSLKEKIDRTPHVVRTGYVTGEPLAQLFSHARLFVLPSYHEGLPIALLEALSYRLSVLVSDIPANLEVGLPSERYFNTGNASHLTEKIREWTTKSISTEEMKTTRELLAHQYNWDRIAERTIGVYRLALD